jgi:DNA modification methylase
VAVDDVAGMVVDDAALRALLRVDDEPDTGATDPDSMPVMGGTIYVKPGDLWQLGDHRLLCGDALDRATWARLMAGQRAALVHTDPPYGVSYESSSGKHDAIANDELTGDGLLDFLAVAFTRLVENSDPTAAFYIWHASANRDEFSLAMKRAGLLERQYLIWVKPSPTLGHADYQQAHEPCFYAHRAGQSPAFFGARDQQTVWLVDGRAGTGKGATIGNGVLLTDGAGRQLWMTPTPPKGRKVRTIRIDQDETLELGQPGAESDAWFIGRDHKPLHPTQKPVEIPRRALTNSSGPGDIVLDPFSGSGSTLMACEQLGRRAYAIELEPHYVQLTIERWQAFTGAKAVRLDG